MKNQPTIEFAIHGAYGGAELSPSNVSAEQFAAIASFVGDFVYVDRKQQKEGDSLKLQIVEGSFGFKVAAASAAAAASVSFSSLAEDVGNMSGGNFGRMSPRRLAALNDFQKKMKPAGIRSVTFNPPGGEEKKGGPFEFTPDTRTDTAPPDIWDLQESVTTAQIIEMGGKEAQNVHLLLPTGKTVIVSSTSEYIRDLDENFMYKDVRVQFMYEQNTRTGKHRNERLVKILGAAKPFDWEQFRKDVERGSEVWADVDDPAEWVREMRG